MSLSESWLPENNLEIVYSGYISSGNAKDFVHIQFYKHQHTKTNLKFYPESEQTIGKGIPVYVSSFKPNRTQTRVWYCYCWCCCCCCRSEQKKSNFRNEKSLEMQSHTIWERIPFVALFDSDVATFRNKAPMALLLKVSVWRWKQVMQTSATTLTSSYTAQNQPLMCIWIFGEI